MNLKRHSFRSIGPFAPEISRESPPVGAPRRSLSTPHVTGSPEAIISVESMFQEISSGTADGSTSPLATRVFDADDEFWQLGLADPQTGMPNRLLLLDRLNQALQRRERHGVHVAVFHVKVAEVDELIRTYGHASGSTVLAEISGRMASVLRAEDTVGRMGGLALIAVVQVDDEEAISTLTQRLQAILVFPFRIGGKDVCIPTSIGIAVALQGETAKEVLARSEGATTVESPRVDA